MSTFRSRLEKGLGWFISVFILPGVAYLCARLYYLDLLDEVTCDEVPSFDRWAFVGLTVIATFGYGLGAWYGHRMDWMLADLMAVVSMLNGLPLILALLSIIELRKVS